MGQLILNYESSEIFECLEIFKELIHLKKCDLRVIVSFLHKSVIRMIYHLKWLLALKI